MSGVLSVATSADVGEFVGASADAHVVCSCVCKVDEGNCLSGILGSIPAFNLRCQWFEGSFLSRLCFSKLELVLSQAKNWELLHHKQIFSRT